MIFARNGTAITFLFGPVLDDAGQIYTSALAYTDLKIVKNGSSGSANASATLTHDHYGYFLCALTVSDVSEVGITEVSLNKSGLTAPAKVLNVLPADRYDWLVNGIGTIEVTAVGSRY